jgi:hypothetical protein
MPRALPGGCSEDPLVGVAVAISVVPVEPVAAVCAGFGTASEGWWKNTLLGYTEMPDYPTQITGEYEMAIGT